MNVQETPIVFECEGSELIGMMHVPETIQTRGVIAIVAGGPQYRGGVGRLQVQLARQLAAAGGCSRRKSTPSQRQCRPASHASAVAIAS